MEHQELNGKRPTVELHENAEEVQREIATGVPTSHYDCFVKIGHIWNSVYRNIY
jgi:hypothetical protein